MNATVQYKSITDSVHGKCGTWACVFKQDSDD